MARTKGALGKKTLAKIADSGNNNTPEKAEKPSTKIVKSRPLYIPYEKSKQDKQGRIITYQTYKKDGVWLIDIYRNGIITLKEFDNAINRLPDAIRFIDSDMARL